MRCLCLFRINSNLMLSSKTLLEYRSHPIPIRLRWMAFPGCHAIRTSWIYYDTSKEKERKNCPFFWVGCWILGQFNIDWTAIQTREHVTISSKSFKLLPNWGGVVVTLYNGKGFVFLKHVQSIAIVWTTMRTHSNFFLNLWVNMFWSIKSRNWLQFSF